jgi:hypothetical protein
VVNDLSVQSCYVLGATSPVVDDKYYEGADDDENKKWKGDGKYRDGSATIFPIFWGVAKVSGLMRGHDRCLEFRFNRADTVRRTMCRSERRDMQTRDMVERVEMES